MSGPRQLFDIMPPHQWQMRASGQYPVEYVRGAAIPVGGDAPYFSVIIEGRVVVHHEDAAGRSELVGRMGPGDTIWVDLGMGEGRGRFFFSADSDVTVAPFSESDYDDLLHNDPELRRRVKELLGAKLGAAWSSIERARLRRAARNRVRRELHVYWNSPLVSSSKATRKIPERIKELSTGREPVLIEGEFGTGKQLIAWRLHNESGLNPETFIPMDCRRLTADNWPRLLFGDMEEGGTAVGVFNLAKGGTLHLRNCEMLPRQAQLAVLDRLQKERERGYGFRIVASAREMLSDATDRELFDKKLYALLVANTIKVVPLRERKKDIPALVEYFVDKYANQLDRNINGVSPEAMRLLINHDYLLGNVMELEQAIERAVALPRGEIIEPRHLFLGAHAAEAEKWRIDLLGWPRFKRWVINCIYPQKLQLGSTIFFLGLIAVCLFGPDSPDNVALTMVWSVWWPLMFFSFFFLGRTWCSVCAYSALADLAKKLKRPNVNLPRWLKDFGVYITLGGFLFVLWIEEVTHMRGSARGTGILMLSMLSMAVACAYFFQRDSWCRYFCPLGGMVGTLSMCSILEVRANTEVCLNRCKKSLCYLGTDDVPGCPMFEHLAFVDNNQTCKLCFNCARSCPHDSIMINLRPPGSEIWLLNQVRDKMSLFVCMLLGVVLPSIWLQTHGYVLEGAADAAMFTLAHAVAPILMAAAMWLPNMLDPVDEMGVAWKRFWMTSYAYVPLAVGSHGAFRLRHVLGDAQIRFQIEAGGGVLADLMMMQPIQLAVMVFGACYSAYCLWRVRARRNGVDFKGAPIFWHTHGVLMVLYAVVTLGLFWAAK